MLFRQGNRLINSRNWAKLVRPEQIVCDSDPNDTMYGKFTYEPLERGYGVTIGNALRRVLLSSLQGAAFVAVKISGVQHEFTTIPGVLEDITDVILNIKQVRLGMTTDEPQHLTLSVSKKGPVTAADIMTNANVEVLNPELHIATLTEDMELSMEFEVRMGKGYVPADMHEGLPDTIGLIKLDASFSPVRKVAYTVEQARVGQMTNYDKLILEVWTDGSVLPEDLLRIAPRLLRIRFRSSSALMNASPAKAEGKAAAAPTSTITSSRGSMSWSCPCGRPTVCAAPISPLSASWCSGPKPKC